MASRIYRHYAVQCVWFVSAVWIQSLVSYAVLIQSRFVYAI